MNLRPAILFAAALILPLAAVEARAPADPKTEIAKVLTRQLKGDYTPHSRAEILAAIQPVDINGDGIQDWQVDWNPFGSAWCGTGGCRYQLWLGRKNGVPVRVFDRRMRAVEVVKRQDRIVFVFDFHGSHCGDFGAEACPGEFAWNAQRGRMELLPSPQRRTSQGKPFERF
jgi:hypothetical protein